jgi:hypothetical protein
LRPSRAPNRGIAHGLHPSEAAKLLILDVL